MRTFIIWLGLIALVGLGASASCFYGPSPVYTRVAGVSLPVYVTPFKPPVEYERWYHQAERCARMTGNFHAIQWGIVPTPWGKTTYGQWNVERNTDGFVSRVEIVVNAGMWDDSLLILHESLHDILWRNGWMPPDLSPLAGPNDSIINLHPWPFRLTGPLGICPAIFYPWPAKKEVPYIP